MKRIIYLLIPVMVLLVACGNKPINFDNQEEVTKAWSDWDNQSDGCYRCDRKPYRRNIPQYSRPFYYPKKFETMLH